MTLGAARTGNLPNEVMKKHPEAPPDLIRCLSGMITVDEEKRLGSKEVRRLLEDALVAL